MLTYRSFLTKNITQKVNFMPHMASAAKRVRSNARKQLRNQTILSAIYTARKSFRSALETDKAKAPELGLGLISLVDKAASKGVIPKGRASRLKSRVGAHLSKLKTGSSK